MIFIINLYIILYLKDKYYYLNILLYQNSDETSRYIC
jgi:hypothetical protein